MVREERQQKKIQVEVITPDATKYSSEADMATVPGTEGEFGVLPDHISLVTRVKPGMISVYGGDKILKQVFVASGFAEVHNSRLSVVCEIALFPEEIDARQADQEYHKLRAELDRTNDEIKVKRLENELELAEAKFQATGKFHQHQL